VKILVAIALALAAVGLALLIYRAEPDTLDQRVKAEMSRQAPPAKPSPSMVLLINVATPSAIPSAPARSSPGPVAQEYAKARALKPLYDRLSAPGGAVSAEAKFVLYKVLATCGHRTDLRAGDPNDPLIRRQLFEKRRTSLEAEIPLTNPDRQRRLALLEEMSSRCAGIEDVAVTRSDLDKLLADAARDGDPKAQARLVFPQNEGNISGNIALSDAQFRTFQSAISSRDPEAILIAGTALSNTYGDALLQIGPDHDELQGRASMEAWRLVACEYGLDCGSDSAYVQGECAYRGHCAANNVQDLTFYYGVTPYEAQLIDQYRQVFRNVVANNDWSGLQLIRQPNTSSSRFYYGIGP